MNQVAATAKAGEYTSLCYVADSVSGSRPYRFTGMGVIVEAVFWALTASFILAFSFPISIELGSK